MSKQTKAGTQRFVLAVGAMQYALEEMSVYYRDFTRQHLLGGMMIWDVQEDSPVAVFPTRYAQAICLEVASGHPAFVQGEPNAPFSDMVEWFNALDDECLESEGLPVSDWAKCEPKLRILERYL